MSNRRQFLRTTSAATLAATATSAKTPFVAAQTRPRKTWKIAIIASVWESLSPAQQLGDRFLVGYPHRGKWHRPSLEIAAAFVDQKTDQDQSAERATEFGFKLYATVEEALCRGGDQLAVDGVLILADYGTYPRNARGQIVYPRAKFAQGVVSVFEKCGRTAPVFLHGALSDQHVEAVAIVGDAKRLGFPLLAGSVLPVTWRMPELELPRECELVEALMIGGGSLPEQEFHAIEAMQCMLERRKGGESGVQAVQLIEGDAVWQAGAAGRWSQTLLSAALSRSDLIMGKTLIDARPQDLVGSGELPRLVKEPAAYFVDYRDGTRAALLMLNGAVGDFTFAARLKGTTTEQSTQFHLPPTPNGTHSACLAAKVEEMITTGLAPYPVERTLLAGGILDSCLKSKAGGQQRLQTPHLNIQYVTPKKPQFCRM